MKNTKIILKFLGYPPKNKVILNGNGPDMRAFTKLLKILLHFFDLRGICPSHIYYLLWYLISTMLSTIDSFKECAENVIKTIEILENLGFTK